MNKKNNSIQMFEDKQIRIAWNAEQEEWYFSVTDVIAILTDSADPKQYIKKMRSRDPECFGFPCPGFGNSGFSRMVY